MRMLFIWDQWALLKAFLRPILHVLGLFKHVNGVSVTLSLGRFGS